MASKRRRTHASRVLSIKEFADFNDLSVHTARRLIKAGQGPAVIELSRRRLGVTERALAEWQQSRTRDAR